MQAFNEPEWIKLLFLLSDTQQWMHDMERSHFMQLPMEGKKKLFRRDYYITASSFAHILERHYYKISRHPGCGKFNISVADILHWIREAFHQPATTMQGINGFIRSFDTGTVIGLDKYGNSSSVITVITGSNGEVSTAFPGEYQGAGGS